MWEARVGVIVTGHLTEVNFEGIVNSAVAKQNGK